MDSIFLDTRAIVSLSLMTLLLMGCGGGGGGGGSDSTPTPTPQAVADNVTVDEDSSISVDVLANDTSVSANTLAIASQPANGNAVLSGNNVDYTPNADFNGSDTLTYSVTGTNNVNLTGVITITVSSVNDLPTATDDTFLVQSNTSTLLSILSNDTDQDGEPTSTEFVTAPVNGTASIIDGVISYQPNNGFSGTDSFTYRAIDNENGLSTNEATVTLTVDAQLTLLTVTSLQIPTESYSQQNNAEFAASVLTSPIQTFTVPANIVSFNLSLRGNGIDDALGNSFFIAGITDPNGNPISPFDPSALFCDTGLCTALVPRSPQIIAEPGEWRFILGTLESNLTKLNFSNMDLELALRSGPKPNNSTAFPTRLKVQPYLTATTVDSADLAFVLTELQTLAAANNLQLQTEPTIVIEDPRFNEVSSDFNNAETAALVSMGAADSINLFFLESFAGIGGSGLVGISGGLPGTMGIQSKYNGVLVNATATLSSNLARYRKSTAEFSLHEIGHFIGLYHTTEQSFESNDILLDTPACEELVHDSVPLDSIADSDECPDGLNLMFWSNDLDQIKDPLSADQRSVYQTAPIGQPSS
jgi:hypothetical protein